MSIRLFNTVVLAEDYDKVVNWYQTAFNFEIILQEKDEYHYTDLGIGDQVVVGIASASEMGHTASTPRNNTTMMQLDVDDIQAVFKSVEAAGGTILFGPDFGEKHQLHYGAVADIEGNQIWVIQMTK